jgi:hypothetical protein
MCDLGSSFVAAHSLLGAQVHQMESALAAYLTKKVENFEMESFMKVLAVQTAL